MLPPARSDLPAPSDAAAPADTGPGRRQALSVLLIAGDHGRAHYAFVLAAGAAALGRRVTLFATNAGCHALAADPSGLADWAREARVEARGVAGLATLREACRDLGVRMIACEAGLRAEAIPAGALLPGVEVAGVATFLEDAGDGQILTL